MNRSPLLALMAASLALVPGAALAAHGKPGLWTVTWTMQAANAPPIPPQALAMMKARHMPIPGEPFTTQMCMTQEQVNADKPPAMNNRDESCDTKVLNTSPELMESEITCHGRMNGTGHMKISWRGNEHYDGTYSFKGVMEGQPHEMSSHYTGDFVKSDCGSVKPMTPPKPMP